ncbi:hypothetical protein AGDE_06588 [Angomonas deanei]|nr:hypothetical protein AGDE_06588 [Angomonas deanei]|eukprot:EPY37346.1 hypothetical protein AGDE_06588 [Angomonas deanei]
MQRGPPRQPLKRPRDGNENENAPVPRRNISHPFRANFNDHFETSLEALRDVLAAVQEVRQQLRPSTPEKFTLYDPYYCSGTVVASWAQLDMPNVINENVDFYATMANHTIPVHDMLVTNPPFSDDHIPRLMKFLADGNDGRPWAFLAPDYVATKPWYIQFVNEHYAKATRVAKGVLRGPAPTAPRSFALPPYLAAGNTAATKVLPVEPFYIIPKQKYDFHHPVEGVGKEHSHFKSMWYVWAGRHTNDVVRASRVELLRRHPTGAAPAVVHGLEALKESNLVASTDKRLNPERRGKMYPKKK